MRLIVLIFLLSIYISCQTKQVEKFYPIKDEMMAEGIYQKYRLKLDTAYMMKDHFEAGVQLSNLKAPSDKIFDQLRIGIREDSINCYEVYEQYKLFVENNFQTNLVKSDTIEFVKLYHLCVETLGEQAFLDFQADKELQYQKRLAQREKLDSTKFNIKLLNELRQIHKNDQLHRIEISKKGVTESEKRELWKKQHYLDSINLVKVDSILTHGYPSKYEVGYDNLSTIWLVLQHQSDYDLRQKYLPILRLAVEEGKLSRGLLKTFEKRDELMRLEK